ncbi:hypothetical protein WICMUC_002677 [Wickerhamomyces mucosus]|uniref:Thioredoxin domain-containing protein n=1 Tax=Wickerhamomyces mucosus TaxID=1378264 RepID=A0A9P8TDK8_9ASCO|nr:hypothetical protein WICMUC_002677 [Wickerhamomyces mucosus]
MFSKSLFKSIASTRTRLISNNSSIFIRGVKTFNSETQPRIRIGSIAPDFEIDTTVGPIKFHEWIGDKWAILFSHPKDFTPICTTELGAFAALKKKFDARNTKLIGLSAEGVDSHNRWIKDIEDITPELKEFTFPIIADVDGDVAFKYDMVDEEGFQNLKKGVVQTIRSVFIIDPSKKVRILFTYPPSVGRNSAEVLRALDALQLTDSKGVVTPINWIPGQDVVIPPTVKDEDAKIKFGEFKTVKPYLRFTKV